MGIGLRNTWTTFTAGEAERITGVSTATQRDWRRRGFFHSEGDGWTKYQLEDLGQLLVMRVLQDRGIGPSVSCHIARAAGLRLAFFALNWTDSIEDNTGGAFEKIVRKGKRPRGGHFVGWVGTSDDPPKYLVAWADGTSDLVSDIGSAFQGSMFDAKYHGAAIVLDLDALGAVIGRRAGRPFVTVDLVEKYKPS